MSAACEGRGAVADPWRDSALHHDLAQLGTMCECAFADIADRSRDGEFRYIHTTIERVAVNAA